MEKIIYINNEPTKYIITDIGRVYNIENHKELKGTYKTYHIFTLRHKNKSYTLRAHILVAQAFLPNPNSYTLVHHKNGNKLDNRVENLEWTTNSINNLKENRAIIGQYQKKLSEETADDIWRPYRNSVYIVSQTGKIKNSITNKMLKGSLDNDGYVQFHLRDTINKLVRLHRVVWEVWGSNLIDGLIINHKDGNKTNNHINNLEQITNQENRIHYLQQLKHSSPTIRGTIHQYTLDGQLLNTFNTIIEASKATGFNRNDISNCINGKTKTCHGFKWKRI